MAKTEGFISNYRILVNLSSHPIGELYLVEHTFHSGPATLLQLWTTIELTSSPASFLAKLCQQHRRISSS